MSQFFYLQKEIVVFLFLFMSFSAFANGSIPAGWREPTQAELAGTDIPWRQSNYERYLSVSADFDGDGRKDRANLLMRVDGEKYGLVVVFANKKSVLIEEETATYLADTGIELLRPGRYQTACGKGYWKCGKGEPEWLILSKPGISYFRQESSSSVIYWPKSSSVWRRIWLSD